MIRRVKKIAGITQKGTYLEGTKSLLQISAMPLPHNVSIYYVYTSECQASSLQYYLGDGTMENKYAINHLRPASSVLCTPEALFCGYVMTSNTGKYLSIEQGI